jgi:hypothetical protein
MLSQNCEKQLIASSRLSVCPMEQLHSRWTEFYEIWWEGNIKTDLQEMVWAGMEWIDLVQITDR